MKIRLTFNHKNGKIPINYAYYIQSWIYSILRSPYIHDIGYVDKSITKGFRTYKLFVFGRLKPTKYRIIPKENAIHIQGPTTLDISFAIPKDSHDFILGLFARANEVYIGSKRLGVTFTSSIQVLSDPLFTPTMSFSLDSPCTIGLNSESSPHAQYIHPNHKKFSHRILVGLIQKYNAMPSSIEQNFNLEKMSLKILNTPKSALVTIKEGTPQQTKIRGYLFDFEITAPIEIIKTGYFAGFGARGSLGFGMAHKI